MVDLNLEATKGNVILCECGHMWSSHRKIEGCLGYADPNRPYEFKKLCECMRFRAKEKNGSV